MYKVLLTNNFKSYNQYNKGNYLLKQFKLHKDSIFLIKLLKL